MCFYGRIRAVVRIENKVIIKAERRSIECYALQQMMEMRICFLIKEWMRPLILEDYGQTFELLMDVLRITVSSIFSLACDERSRAYLTLPIS